MQIVALSLKMYFSYEQTIQYCKSLTNMIAHESPSNIECMRNNVELMIFPDFLSLREATKILRPYGIKTGAQDLCMTDRGAFTGEVSPKDLVSLGVSFAEIGHVERRTIFKESDFVISQKVDAAWRNGLTPLLCVGEQKRAEPEKAAKVCIQQIESATEKEPMNRTSEDSSDARTNLLQTFNFSENPLYVAYEPVWAIGASDPAPREYVMEICGYIKEYLSFHFKKNAVIYGGAAGPGLLVNLWPFVDGIFLGRFAHTPEAFMSVIHEAMHI